MTVIEYFSLNEQPFGLGPDPRYLFYSGQVKEAIAKCEYMARNRVGPIYMYGPIGSGKTSILRRLTERLGNDKKYTAAYVIAANVRRANTFLKIIMQAFDVQTVRSYDEISGSLKPFWSISTRRVRLLCYSWTKHRILTGMH
jgi:type II secretory pathway predicted ATPase ExeA